MGKTIERTRRRRTVRRLITLTVVAAFATTVPAVGAQAARAASASAPGPRLLMSPDGPSLRMSLTADSTGVVAFMGVSGEQVSVGTSSGTFGSNCDVTLTIVGPDGDDVGPPACAGTSGVLDAVALSENGTYKAKFSAGGSAAGSITVTIKSVGALKSVTPNAKRIPITIDAARQLRQFAFSAHAGEKFSAMADPGNIARPCRIYLTIADSTGESLASGTCAGEPSGGFVQAGTAPVDGIYYLLARESDGVATPAAFHARLFRVHDTTQAADADGHAVPFEIRRPGQLARFTFAGTTGQNVSVVVSGVMANEGGYTYFLRPDGSYPDWQDQFDGGPFLDTGTLDATGTWTVIVDPALEGHWTGSATIQIFTVEDVVRHIAPARHQTIDITTPGQNAQVRFHGTVGDERTVTITNVSLSDDDLFTAGVIRPDGSTLTSRVNLGPDDTFSVTLDVAGRYSIVLGPAGPETGAVRVDLS